MYPCAAIAPRALPVATEGETANQAIPDVVGPLGVLTGVATADQSVPAAKTAWFMRMSLVSRNSSFPLSRSPRGVGPGFCCDAGVFPYTSVSRTACDRFTDGRALESELVLVSAQRTMRFSSEPVKNELRKYSVPPAAASKPPPLGVVAGWTVKTVPSGRKRSLKCTTVRGSPAARRALERA